MIEWPNATDKLIALAGDLAILIAGVRIMAMGWEAPDRESMPLVVTKEDLDQYNLGLRIRQVLLFFFGVILVGYAAFRLAR